jgi:hypothetical protein
MEGPGIQFCFGQKCIVHKTRHMLQGGGADRQNAAVRDGNAKAKQVAMGM